MKMICRLLISFSCGSLILRGYHLSHHRLLLHWLLLHWLLHHLGLLLHWLLHHLGLLLHWLLHHLGLLLHHHLGLLLTYDDNLRLNFVLLLLLIVPATEGNADGNFEGTED